MTRKVICFHKPGEPNDYLSNWYYSDFILDGMRFNSVEQYMMYNKAITFGDTETAQKILNTNNFKLMKQLGREVHNYNDRVWSSIRYDVVKAGVLAKFSQNAGLAEKLLNTGNSLLAECAVRDRIWGIGLGMSNPDRFNPAMWKGQNLLGKVLMDVRNILNGQK